MSKDIAHKIRKAETRINSDTEYLKENPYFTMKFIDLLYLFIHKKFPNEKDSFIYNKACIDAKLFSKIRNPNYHPSRKTVISLGLALELNLHEFESLLTSAHYSFSFNNTFDIAIVYCIEHKIYNLYIVNDILYELGL